MARTTDNDQQHAVVYVHPSPAVAAIHTNTADADEHQAAAEAEYIAAVWRWSTLYDARQDITRRERDAAADLVAAARAAGCAE